MKVVVENVGRNKRTWEMEVWDEPRAAAEQILTAVKKSGALMSRDIDVSWNEAGDAGNIEAGFHHVGTWRKIAESAGVPS